MLSSPRSMLRYVIRIATSSTLRAVVLWLRLLTLFPWQGTHPAVLQLFPRYSVDIYKCINASELISHRRSPCGLQKLWITAVHVQIAIATEVIQLPHSRQQACFINVEVSLVTLTDGSAQASSRKHVVTLSFVVVKEYHGPQFVIRFSSSSLSFFGTCFTGHYFIDLTFCTRRCCWFTCDLLLGELHNS